MLLGIGSRIYRDRRRLSFVIAMAFLSGYIMYLRADIYVGDVHIAWLIGSIYAGVIGACALFICLVLPSMRFMMEAVSVSRLGLSLVVFCAPEFAAPILVEPLLMAAVIVFGGTCVSRVLHGRIIKDKARRWRDRFLPQFGIQRMPVRIEAGPMQTRFVGWIDNAAPLKS